MIGAFNEVGDRREGELCVFDCEAHTIGQISVVTGSRTFILFIDTEAVKLNVSEALVGDLEVGEEIIECNLESSEFSFETMI